jgi:hypothetical protein
LKQVSTEITAAYQYYWPMSFLEDDLCEDVVIYCPPQTLVSGDISSIIEKSYVDEVIVAPRFVSIQLFANAFQTLKTENNLEFSINDNDIDIFALWFVSFPKSIRQHLVGTLPAVLERLGLQESRQTDYHQIIAELAYAFAFLVRDKKIKYELIEADVMYELSDGQLPLVQTATNFEDVLIFSLSEAPESKPSWDDVFHDVNAVQDFLNDGGVTQGWLYYQRDLRRIHTSLNKVDISLINRHLFQAVNSPYYIYGLDFVQNSAGIRALHYLCHALNESGQEAYITCENISPLLRTPVLTEAVLMQHYAAGRKPIMVYPEIISGDPMAAGGVVVRWLLNQAGHVGGDTAFAADDIIFAYDDLHLTQDMRGEILHIPTGNTAIFNNDDNPYDDARDLVCYYAHKYLYNGGQLTEQVQGAISLCKDQVLTHAEIAAILRRSKLLYVYESTSLIEEALLCGCPVSVIETDYWRNNMANYAYTGDIGVVMDDSPESIALATANVHKYRELHENVVVRDAWRQIDRFVEITQNAAKLKAQYS